MTITNAAYNGVNMKLRPKADIKPTPMLMKTKPRVKRARAAVGKEL